MQTQKIYPKVIVVDQNNENPRAVTYEEAVSNNWFFRASKVFVVDESKRVLIQQRSRHITRPLLLDFSVAGHVDEGEEYIDAAVRELCEELGIKAIKTDLVELHAMKHANVFSQVYKLSVPSSLEIITDPCETEDYFWMTAVEIDAVLSLEPEKFTKSFVEVWELLRDKLISA